jgi:hypothetical protein
MTLLYNVQAVPSALIDAALSEQDLLCRILGRCRFGDPIDRELKSLVIGDEEARTSGLGPFAPKRFTYVRYNPVLTKGGLTGLGLGSIDAKKIQRMDSAKYLPELMAVGKAYAKRLDLAHFGPFDPGRPA